MNKVRAMIYLEIGVIELKASGFSSKEIRKAVTEIIKENKKLEKVRK